MSPVCSQPSGSMVSAVAWGLLRYPFMMCGPRTQISPESPCSTSSPVDTSTMRHSLLGTNPPTEPGFPQPSRAMWVAGLVSVMP